MQEFYVYVYRDPSRNNEPIYVGKGQGRRAYKHLTRKDKHPFTQRLQLMKRNGIEPDIQILPCESEEFALLAEEEAIDRFGRKDLGRGTLLNLTDGGEGHSNPTLRTREKQSANNKGEKNPMYGKKDTEETRAKKRAANGNPSAEIRAKISASCKGKGKIKPMQFINSSGDIKKFKLGDIIPEGYDFKVKYATRDKKYEISPSRILINTTK